MYQLDLAKEKTVSAPDFRAYHPVFHHARRAKYPAVASMGIASLRGAKKPEKAIGLRYVSADGDGAQRAGGPIVD